MIKGLWFFPTSFSSIRDTTIENKYRFLFKLWKKSKNPSHAKMVYFLILQPIPESVYNKGVIFKSSFNIASLNWARPEGT